MSNYFVSKNVANMMTKPNSSSALDSQAIAGMAVTLEKTENDYCFVKTPDGYEGWVSKLRLAEIWDISTHKKICVKTLFADVYPGPNEKTYPQTKLVISSCLPVNANWVDEHYVEIILPDKQKGYVKKSCVEPWEQSAVNETILKKEWQGCEVDTRQKIIARVGEKIVEQVRSFVGTPYLWGGCTPFGIDCSGLSQLTYKLNGIQLLRNSYMQAEDKRFVKIGSGQELDRVPLNSGDLVFFDLSNPTKTKINHVGIACGDGTFIQARGEICDGGVVVSQCRDPFYKQTFMGAVRLSAQADIILNSSLRKNV